MRLPRTKHDSLFRLIVADPQRAQALLLDYLPPAIAAGLAPDSLPERVDGTAIDGASPPMTIPGVAIRGTNPFRWPAHDRAGHARPNLNEATREAAPAVDTRPLHIRAMVVAMGFRNSMTLRARVTVRGSRSGNSANGVNDSVRYSRSGSRRARARRRQGRFPDPVENLRRFRRLGGGGNGMVEKWPHRRHDSLVPLALTTGIVGYVEYRLARIGMGRED